MPLSGLEEVVPDVVMRELQFVGVCPDETDAVAERGPRVGLLHLHLCHLAEEPEQCRELRLELMLGTL